MNESEDAFLFDGSIWEHIKHIDYTICIPVSDTKNLDMLACMRDIYKTIDKDKEEAKENKADTPTEDDITKAINKLNDSMNEDINNTVKEGDTQINTTTPIPATATVQSGGKRESRLTKKIKLLRLKLTKNKLERELQNELQKTNKTNHIVKQTVSQNKKHSSGKKYSMKKNKRN